MCDAYKVERQLLQERQNLVAIAVPLCVAILLCSAFVCICFLFTHIHFCLYMSTWFRSGVDSRHSDQGRFCCIFVCLCLEFSEAPVRVTLDLVLLSLGLGVIAIWISVTVTLD